MAVILSEKFFTFDEAAAKVGEPYTCFTFVTHRKHISLSPKFIGKIAVGIHEMLKLELNHYSECMEGIPVAYRKPKCVQHCGAIMDESPYIHITVEVEYVLFQPKQGSIMRGKVNKLGSDHVSCLVHGIFNASIHFPQNDKETNLIKSKLEGNMEVEFEVTEIKTRSGIVSICGKIPSAKNAKKRKRSGLSDYSTHSIDDVSLQEVQGAVSGTNSKSKKRKKSKDKEQMSDSQSLDTSKNDDVINIVTSKAISNNIPNSQLSIDCNGDSSQKKHKRSHKEAILDSAFNQTASAIPTSDPTDGKKLKKKKKSKDIDSTDNVKVGPQISQMESTRLETSQTKDFNPISASSFTDKSKDIKIQNEGPSNKETELTIDSIIVNSSGKKKKKKDKKQKELVMDRKHSVCQEVVIKNEFNISSSLDSGIDITGSRQCSQEKIEMDPELFGSNDVNDERKKSKKHKKKKKSSKQEPVSP